MGQAATKLGLRSGGGEDAAETKVDIDQASDELIDELTVLTKCASASQPSDDTTPCHRSPSAATAAAAVTWTWRHCARVSSTL